MFTFHTALIPSGKLWIRLISLELTVNLYHKQIPFSLAGKRHGKITLYLNLLYIEIGNRSTWIFFHKKRYISNIPTINVGYRISEKMVIHTFVKFKKKWSQNNFKAWWMNLNCFQYCNIITSYPRHFKSTTKCNRIVCVLVTSRSCNI